MSSTPKMTSSVPCDGKWHRIVAGDRMSGYIFIDFTGTTCTFTARLVDNPPPPAPGAPAAKPIVKSEIGIPADGGWRGLSSNIFDHFEVKCEPPAPPKVKASRKGDPPPAAVLKECEFEWYMYY